MFRIRFIELKNARNTSIIFSVVNISIWSKHFFKSVITNLFINK